MPVPVAHGDRVLNKQLIKEVAMRTPAGNECSFFYGNYYRGRQDEECRLIGTAPAPNNWTPNLCKTCPVPGIQRANSCPNMILEAKVEGKVLRFKRRVKITAYCNKSHSLVKQPEIGCGLCHPLPDIFIAGEK
jgi:hypothetical protein